MGTGANSLPHPIWLAFTSNKPKINVPTNKNSQPINRKMNSYLCLSNFHKEKKKGRRSKKTWEKTGGREEREEKKERERGGWWEGKAY